MYRSTNLLILVCSFYLWFGLGHAVSSDVNDLKFYYFRSVTDGVQIQYNDQTSLDNSNIQAATETIVVIDGFMSNLTTPTSLNVKNAHVKQGGANVIVLDWSAMSGDGTDTSNLVNVLAVYTVVLNSVPAIGQRIADFLDFLRAYKQIEFSAVTIVAHSLGAHIAGDAGKAVKNTYGGLLGRIVGMDPAGPFYHLQLDPALRLASDDAEFVAVYHTNRGGLGIIDDIGQANVYVNGGSSQPGCTLADLTGFPGTNASLCKMFCTDHSLWGHNCYCSHAYAVKLYVASFTTTMTACPCNLVTCICSLCTSRCANGLQIGPNMPAGASGLFSVSAGQL